MSCDGSSRALSASRTCLSSGTAKVSKMDSTSTLWLLVCHTGIAFAWWVTNNRVSLVAGESGLGKSTLVSTLFDMPLYPPRSEKRPSAEIPKTVAIQSISADLEERGVKLRLTVVDTPGFGDFVNNEDAWRPIVENIEQRFDAFLEAENKANRANIVDNRIHAVIYFIGPTGHSLKPLDIEVMTKLRNKVNLIPVIAKSDILTDEEIVAFKARVR
jgi:septin 7